MYSERDRAYMALALELAREAEDLGEVPIGAVLVSREGDILGKGMNSSVLNSDPTAHAEINALRQAGLHLGNYRLVDTRMFVTIEPCCMCFGAMIHARVAELVYAVSEPKAGALGSGLDLPNAKCFNHKIKVSSGLYEAESKMMIQNFFMKRRRKKE